MPSSKSCQVGTAVEPTPGGSRATTWPGRLAFLGMFVVHFGLVMAADHERPAWAVAILESSTAGPRRPSWSWPGSGWPSGRAGRSRRPTPGDSGAGGRWPAGAVPAGRRVREPGDLAGRHPPGLRGVAARGGVLRATRPGRRLLAGRGGRSSSASWCCSRPSDYGKNWDWETMTYHRLWTPGRAVRNLFYDGFRSVFPWTGLLFYGIWLGRLDLRDRAVNTGSTLAAPGCVLAAEVASRLLPGLLPGPSRRDGRRDDPGPVRDDLDAPAPAVPAVRRGRGDPGDRPLRPAGGGPPRRPVARALRRHGADGVHLVLRPHRPRAWAAVVALGLATARPLPVGEAAGLVFFAAALVVSWAWKRGSGTGRWNGSCGRWPGERPGSALPGRRRRLLLPPRPGRGRPGPASAWPLMPVGGLDQPVDEQDVVAQGRAGEVDEVLVVGEEEDLGPPREVGQGLAARPGPGRCRS